MTEPITLTALLKLPFAMIWRAAKWIAAFFTAPHRLARLEQKVADAQDPRPICTVCAKGRVAAFHYDPGGAETTPKTYGVCNNVACRAEWLMTHDGASLRRMT